MIVIGSLGLVSGAAEEMNSNEVDRRLDSTARKKRTRPDSHEAPLPKRPHILLAPLPEVNASFSPPAVVS